MPIPDPGDHQAPNVAVPGQPRKKPDGLRERKKARAKAAIQQNAPRLFREQGYTSTTIEQIATSAEVAPSTVSATSQGKKSSSRSNPILCR